MERHCLDELKELGFDAIELSRHLTWEQIEQIKPHLATTRRSVLSTTFAPFCTVPSQSEAENDPIHLASLDADTRETKRLSRRFGRWS